MTPVNEDIWFKRNGQMWRQPSFQLAIPHSSVLLHPSQQSHSCLRLSLSIPISSSLQLPSVLPLILIQPFIQVLGHMINFMPFHTFQNPLHLSCSIHIQPTMSKCNMITAQSTHQAGIQTHQSQPTLGTFTFTAGGSNYIIGSIVIFVDETLYINHYSPYFSNHTST